MKIRCVTAYGPQAVDSNEKKEKFWGRLIYEAEQAVLADCAFLLQMDGNLHLGPTIIKGDPQNLDQNGKYFLHFLRKCPHLSLINSFELTEGTITRRRQTTKSIEQSVIDFFVTCNRLVPFIDKLIIDENKEHVLTSYNKRKGKSITVDSDHHTMILKFNINFQETSRRKEIYDVRKSKSIQRNNIK